MYYSSVVICYRSKTKPFTPINIISVRPEGENTDVFGIKKLLIWVRWADLNTHKRVMIRS
jgi:hypothetical protein